MKLFEWLFLGIPAIIGLVLLLIAIIQRIREHKDEDFERREN